MKKVFIDCGTNMGMGFADLAPKLGIDHTWEVFGFEPNVYAYDAYVENINSGRYPVLNNKNFNLQQKAVWFEDTTIDFCHESCTKEYGQEDIDRINKSYKDGKTLDYIDYNLPATGGSCVKEIHDQLQRPESHAKKLHFPKTDKVEAINFSKWILKNFTEDDLIILKMDIEGSEYKVLPKMIEDGSIKYINTLIIEWHNWQLPQYDELTNLLFSEISSLGIQVMGWG
jgi:FkbM family methyltransferase